MTLPFQLENYIEECITLYLTEKHSQDPHFRELLRTMMLQADPTVAVKQYEAIINMTEPFNHLVEINCPTLVIRGKYDQRHSLQGHQALSHKIPHSELIVIDDAAHFIPLENPRVLAEHIKKFIARNS